MRKKVTIEYDEFKNDVFISYEESEITVMELLGMLEAAKSVVSKHWLNEEYEGDYPKAEISD